MLTVEIFTGKDNNFWFSYSFRVSLITARYRHCSGIIDCDGVDGANGAC